ncbi:VOC family protein [Nocardiopsis chromatogenes]|uniref:VOC family protein n=1 Tax=Nocardiopsis chromatogenes TaxID=280239 RepID=UPI000476BBC7|nr:VOC family protein [Nocardiopsis chromatogenes]
MALRFVQVNINASDPSRLGRFWADALGWEVTNDTSYEVNLEPAGFTYPEPSALVVDLVPVDDPKVGKNRVHLDLASHSAEHYAQTVRRLEGLGATRTDIGQGEQSWTVLADPEGNEFCVLEPRESYQGTGPIAAVAVDCADPAAQARFWSRATDWEVHDVDEDGARLRSAAGTGPYVEFIPTPDAKTVKNRVHFDLRPYPGDDQAAEADRLRALGATDVDVGQRDEPWIVLADPEGNEFCILTAK